MTIDKQPREILQELLVSAYQNWSRAQKTAQKNPDDLLANHDSAKWHQRLLTITIALAKLAPEAPPPPPDLNDFFADPTKPSNGNGKAEPKPKEISHDASIPDDDGLKDLMAEPTPGDGSVEDDIADITPGTYQAPVKHTLKKITNPRQIQNRIDNKIRVQKWRQGYQRMIKELGAQCSLCPESRIAVLELDHIEQRTWHPNRYPLLSRLAKLQKEFKENKLRVLCRSCNARLGSTIQQGKRNY